MSRFTLTLVFVCISVLSGLFAGMGDPNLGFLSWIAFGSAGCAILSMFWGMSDNHHNKK